MENGKWKVKNKKLLTFNFQLSAFNLYKRSFNYNMAKIKIKLTKSLIGRSDKQIKTANSLGLRKIGDISEHEEGPVLDGKLKVISHLVTTEK